ncbi:MAG: phosphoethanolamine transferase [Flavobacteriaceae bacterium]
MRIPRPTLGSNTLALIAAAYVAAVLNITFWHKTLALTGGSGPRLAFLGLFSLALLALLFVVASPGRLAKPVLVFLVLASAAAAYFTDTFGILITRQMIENAAVTTAHEAKHLITGDFLIWFAGLGLLPAAAIAWVRVRPSGIAAELRRKTVLAGALLATMLGSFATDYPFYAALLREHHEMLGSLNPVAPLTSAVRYAVVAYRQHNLVVEPIATDARRAVPAGHRRKPTVMVIVVGETARAANFGLDGYERDTTPELARRGVVNFPNATSCGTATETSVPCMFSMYGRERYSGDLGRSHQTLLDVVESVGVKAEWWDNNTGSKGVADRVAQRGYTYSKSRELCPDGECVDGIMAADLPAFLDRVDGDTVLVLHQIGSHGPAYYQRYPHAFARFLPECRTAQFGDCTREEIVNAYDNTILYTDSFLAGVIDELSRRSDTLSGMMIYMSDHGESLGEDGLYLHGMPYFMAPETQTHVPFIVWLSGEAAADEGIDMGCLRASSRDSVSHDNLFHSVLGALHIQTAVYDPALDIFARCHERGTAQTAPAVPGGA